MGTVQRLLPSLCENLEYLEEQFENCADYVVRRFTFCTVSGALVTVDGLVNKQNVTISVLNPLMHRKMSPMSGLDAMEYVKTQVLGAVEQVPATDFDTLIQKLMGGFAVLLLNGCDYGLCFGIQGYAVRSPQEPDNETMQYGAKDGFVESFQTNMMLIRRRLHTTDMKFEQMTVGTQSKTQVLVCYLKSVASPEIVAAVKKKLAGCNIKNLLATEYLSSFLTDSGIFNNIGYTERPDSACGKLAEGRIAIIVDGSATVAVLPHLFVENFHTVDDYATRPYYAAVTRLVKYGAFFISVFLPGLYVAVCGFHPELLPETLLLKVAKSEAFTPFPIMTESLLAYFMYDLMREAGLRVPKSLSNAVSIVGALVIGDMAVSAGIMSEVTLVVIAITAIAGYVLPKLYQQTSVLCLVFIVVGGTAGIWGIVLGMALLLYNVCAQRSCGIPVSSPMSPFSFSAMRDMVLRFSWKRMSAYTSHVQNMPGAPPRVKDDE